MKICIIDDEKSNRDILKYLIHHIDNSINIVGEADNVKNGIAIIHQTQPDLIFLDIEMPDGTGFDLIQQLDQHQPEIIFCTAYNQFALKAIECSALAYILKPITKDVVAQALQKANKKIDGNLRILQYNILEEQLKQLTTIRKRFLLPTAENLHLLYYDELICCIADSNYTSIYLENGKKIVVAKTLKEMAFILASHPQFYRVHQSNIINLEKIKSISKTDNHLSVLMKNDMEIMVSRNKRAEFLLAIRQTFL
ncbi:MAG: LytTR family DNA-binding domain-containing protein [Chitinophagales bacterium]|nr:LytTR family DNA-binding domain-containing protein [Chitinophagales bacterium]